MPRRLPSGARVASERSAATRRKAAPRKRRVHPAPSESSPPAKARLEEDARSGPPEGAASSSDYTVVVRYREAGGEGGLRLHTDDRRFYPLAQELQYVVANRRRITRDTRDQLGEEVFSRIRGLLGLDARELRNSLQAMAGSGVVEVEIPFESEGKGWAARVFPWESIIGLLTKRYREEAAALTVVRHLKGADAGTVDDPPVRLLVVRSGPGELGRLFDLEREQRMVGESLGLPREDLAEPDRGTLAARVKAFSPSIVHLAGLDPLSLETYDLATVPPERRDGFVLRGDAASQYDCVTPFDLAEMLNGAPTRPLLVAVSTCFSAARTAAMAAALGARYAIGFQDTITDADALLFFSAFYRGWAGSWAVLPAFQEARAQFMKEASNQAGGGVVLWSRHSLLAPLAKPAAPRSPRPAKATAAARRATPDDLTLYITPDPDRAPGPGRRETLSLNYSLLHNNRSPYESFLIDKRAAGKLPPLRVQVSLEVGSESCRCQFSVELPEDAKPVELADKIRLPLVAGLLRQCTESLRTNLYARVECGDRLLCERNDRVTVLPADEWRDDGKDHRWLPSFVLPRDPAVLRIIGAAQRYLCTLLDDCAAGFDGYQQLSADDANAADVVDSQAQAIWAALQHDLALNYINPPPSYSSQSQRLRSPSQILEGKAATCIDLALLFASCLEFVGIYPVVFLVTGHAFPGYWRSDKAWWRMKQFGMRSADAPALATRPPGEPEGAANVTLTAGQGEGWLFAGIDNLAELLRYVQAGSLVPFESTFVTAKRGFFEALEQAPGRLHPDSFDAMIDVQSARGENVTPLPYLDRRG